MDIIRDEKYILYIRADTNDADYVTSENELTGAEILDDVAPVVRQIEEWNKTHRRGSGEHNWPAREWDTVTPQTQYSLTDEIADLWSYITPYGEYGIHTIESVEVRPITEVIILL